VSALPTTELTGAGLGFGPVPVEPCVSPAYFAAEREHLFRKAWMNVAHRSEVPNPGDYVVKPLPTLGVEVLLVRDKAGQLGAYYNVCTHRNNKVVRGSTRGNCKGFSCGFHGWRYDLQGRLVDVPDEEQFIEFDKQDYGLRQLAVDSWENFIFVFPTPNPPMTLRQWLGEIDVDITGGPLTKLIPTARFRAEVNVNWKVFSDAFCEGYHVGYIHKRSLAGSFISESNPHCHIAGVRLYQHHSIVSILGGNPKHIPTPTELLVGKFGGGSYGSRATGFDHLPKGLNPERDLSWNFDIVNVFPNFAVHVGADFAYSYNFWPVAADRTIWDVAIYQRPPNNWSEAVALNYMRVLLRDSLREDVNTTEDAQQNLNAGIMQAIPLSQQEVVLRHRYKVVERWLAQAEQ
jgi:phenylpropionate dioxygenase-like ring-hydroxylating dioxygenase large terminal subunit